MNGKARLRPWEIRQLTFAEIALYLDQDGDKPRPPTGDNLTREQIIERQKQRQALSVHEKLRLAREGAK